MFWEKCCAVVEDAVQRVAVFQPGVVPLSDVTADEVVVAEAEAAAG